MQPGLTEIIKSVLDVDSVSEADSMRTIPSWDSLRHVNLVMAIEEHFGISFDSAEIPELTSVREINSAIERITQQNKPPAAS
jgi:acyl carrier protein